MSTDNVTYNFHPHCNYIFGPNGTGKSTIVCALYIIFNGNVKTLGRGTALPQYINNRRSGNRSRITVVISTKDNGRMTIRRVWNATSNSTQWFTQVTRNGRESFVGLTKPDLLACIKKYNLNVENLFQFLPQEKVNEMSDLNPSMRLMSFEKAISDGRSNLHDRHNELIDHQKAAGDSKEEIEEQERQLMDYQQQFEREKPRVQMYREYTSLTGKVNILSAHISLSEFSFAEVHSDNCQAEYGEWEELHQDLREKVLAKLISREDILSQKDKKIRKQLFFNPSEKGSQCYKYLEKMQVALNSTQRHARNAKNIGQEIEAMINQDRALGPIIAEKELEIRGVKEDIARMSGKVKERQDKAKARMAVLQAEILHWKEEGKNMDAKIDTKKALLEKEADSKRQMESMLSEMKNVDKTRINSIRNSWLFSNGQVNLENTFKLKAWIEQNQDQFEEEVMMPAVFSLVATGDALDVLINSVSSSDMMTFVTQTEQDNNTLYKASRDIRLTRIATAVITDQQRNLDYWKAQSLNYKSLGFDKLLIHEISAPESLLCYLCSTAKIHQLPWATREPRLDNLSNEDDAVLTQYFVMGDDNSLKKVRRKRNKYTGSTDIVAEHDSRKRDLSRCFTLQMSEERIAEVTNDIGACAKNIEQLTRDTFDNKKIRSAISKEVASRVTEEQNCRTEIAGGSSDSQRELKKHYRALNDILKQKKNVPALFINQKHKQMNEVKSGIKAFKIYSAALKNCINKCQCPQDKVEEALDIMVDLTSVRKERQKEEKKFAQQEQQGRELKEILDEAKRVQEQSLTRFRVHCSRNEWPVTGDSWLKRATKKIKDSEYSQATWFPRQRYENKIVFNLHKDDVLRDIRTLHGENRVSLERIEGQFDDDDLEDGESMIESYHRLEKKIIHAQKTLEKKKADSSKSHKKSEDLKAAWLPELKTQISYVAKRFKDNFATINCEADLRLKVPDNVEAYDEYGLDILAQFRVGEETAVIRVNRQSGGERSVAAMLFLLSMPTRNCPFRLVDEINQGMDSSNERNVMRVIQQLTDNAPEQDLCQLFIISPKILRNIKYCERGMVTIIHNLTPIAPRELKCPMAELKRVQVHDEDPPREVAT